MYKWYSIVENNIGIWVEPNTADADVADVANAPDEYIILLTV